VGTSVARRHRTSSWICGTANTGQLVLILTHTAYTLAGNNPAKEMVHMGVGWVEHIYNNTGDDWYISSHDKEHNGTIRAVDSNGRPIGGIVKLDDGGYKKLNANTQYADTWCGIPWYVADESHFKSLASTQNGPGIKIYQSEISGSNYIVYEDPSNGKRLGATGVPVGLFTDYHCHIRIENDGIYFDVVNDNGNIVNAITYVFDEAAKLAPIAAAILGATLKATATKNG
jgi:hypothetical protein